MSFTATTSCPGYLVGRILGKGKVHLGKVETDYEVEVTLPKERSAFQTFQVKGEMNNVRTAIMDINDRVAKLQEWQARRKHYRELNHIKNKSQKNSNGNTENAEVVSTKSVFDAFNEVNGDIVVESENVEKVIENNKNELERIRKQEEREAKRAKKRGIKVDPNEVLYIKGRTGELKRENWLRRQAREQDHINQYRVESAENYVPQELPETASWWN